MTLRAMMLSVQFAGSFLSSASAGADCLSIGVPAGAGATAEIMEIVTEAGKRSGLCVKAVRAPRNRFSSLALDGVIITESPEPPGGSPPILVPTPIVTLEGTLYWPEARPEPTGPQALIGVILGQDWALREVAARGARPYEVRDNMQLLQMMVAGRLDGMMLPSVSLRHFLPRFPDAGKLQSKIVTDLPMLIQLQPSRAASAVPLDQALATLRQEGYVDRIFKRYAP